MLHCGHYDCISETLNVTRLVVSIASVRLPHIIHSIILCRNDQGGLMTNVCE